MVTNKMTTTDTPRTDAELEKPRDGVYSSFFSMASHAKQLERELAEAKAEVERLRNGMQGSCYCCEPVGEMNQKLEAEVALAQREADSLAQSLNRRFYSEKASWGLCDSVAGVISQIDNMAAGLGQRAEKAEAEVERLRASLKAWTTLD